MVRAANDGRKTMLKKLGGSAMTDSYALLGVAPDAGADQIKAA